MTALALLGGTGLRAQLVTRQQGLEATLQEAVTAFEQADYARAANGFSALAQTYADEPAYRKIEQRLLPVWAHAARMNGDPARAAELYETFLETYPGDDAQASFVLFGLAQACQELGENTRAADAYRRYRERFPDRPEALLSVLREADLAFATGDTQTGLDSLLAFAASPRVPPTLRAQARLRAVQAAQAYGHDERAADILLSEPWAITTMPELAVLAYAGLRAGDYLSRTGRTTDAILAYRNVPPRAQLIELQRARLVQLEQIREERTRRNPQGIQNAAFWEEYFGGLIEKVRAELAELERSQDYTPAWQLRLGEAFLRDNRSREAGLIFGAMAADISLPDTLRAQAHYRWILCAQARQDWPLALRRADAFLLAYPGDPLAPATLYLCAEALLQSDDTPAAITALDRLISQYPDDERQPHWRFRRGYAKVLAQDYTGAREDFSSVIADHSEGTLSERARLWTGMSWFFEYNYLAALAEFDNLLASSPIPFLRSEAAYRRAATLYSMRNYTEAKAALESFLEDHPADPHAAAVRVLLGDTLMGLGDLDAAVAQFATLTPEDGALYSYATFQAGKIYRVSENYDKLISHFKNYANEARQAQLPRLAEALYWIGWAKARQGDPAAGFPQFISALERTGDDPAAGEIAPLLQALESLYVSAKQGDIDLGLAPDAQTRSLLASPTFAQWLEDERNAALDSQELTRASRLALYLASLSRREGRADRADALLFQTVEQVPIDHLDAEGLSTLGALLAEFNSPDAQDYFTHQLKAYPRSERNGTALLGLARLAARSGDNSAADKWLRRFEAETPFSPEAPQAALLHARVLADMGKPDAAQYVLEKQLQSPAGRGRPHAEALLTLADIARQQGNHTHAIPYYQRVYTLYRAYPDLLARAYWQSALAFQAIGDNGAALRTLEEMTSDARLSEAPEYTQARELIEQLRQSVSNNGYTTIEDDSPQTEATP
nr:tetratricopeptide repeat protein [Ruficoccus amylovorans]